MTMTTETRELVGLERLERLKCAAATSRPDVTVARSDLRHALATITRLTEEVEGLEKRGAEAVIAYHVAICSPKGVVPDDTIYDPVMAGHVQKMLDAGLPARATLARSGSHG